MAAAAAAAAVSVSVSASASVWMTCHCSWTRGAVIFAAAAAAGGRHPPTLEDANDEMTVTPVVLMGILPCLLVTYHVYHWYCDLGEGPYSIFRKIEIRWMEGWMMYVYITLTLHNTLTIWSEVRAIP